MSDEPSSRYLHVAAALRAQIASGTYSVGSEIPTVAALAIEFDVSHMTVKNALTVLKSEGVVTTHRGARTRVSALPTEAAKPLLEQVTDLYTRVDGLDARVAALESHANKRRPEKRP